MAYYFTRRRQISISRKKSMKQNDGAVGVFSTGMNRESSSRAARAYQQAERRRSYMCMHYSSRAIGCRAALLSGVGRTT